MTSLNNWRESVVRCTLAALFLTLLAGPACAFSYIIDLAGAPQTTLTTAPGIPSTSGDPFFIGLIPADAYEYATPSVLSLGQLFTVPQTPGADQSGHYAADADYYFLIGRGNGSGAYTAGPDLIHARAFLSGDLVLSAAGIASSTAAFTGGTGTVISGPNIGVTSVSGTDPENGFPANVLVLTYDGTPVNLYVDLVSSVPAPGAADLSLSGYITDQSVPEPDPRLPLLLSMSIFFFIRTLRRRYGRPR